MLQIFKLILLLTMTVSASSQAKQLALSFDDGLNPDTNPDALAINTQILLQLENAQIHSIIYPSLIKLGGAAGLELVAEWGKHGHLIGNHSERHLNLNEKQVSIPEYLDGIEKAERVLKPMKGWTARYRFPYLKEGNTTEKRDTVRTWLHDRGYRSAAVSIDASDWFYNLKYLEYLKAGNMTQLVTLKKAYIWHLLDRAAYYDALAKNTLGYSPRHVMLLHTNRINAESLQEIIAAFKNRGWEWISAGQAYEDPIYTQQPDVLPAGESIVWSIARKNGVTTLRYPAEDAPYELENLRKAGLK